MKDFLEDSVIRIVSILVAIVREVEMRLYEAFKSPSLDERLPTEVLSQRCPV